MGSYNSVGFGASGIARSVLVFWVVILATLILPRFASGEIYANLEPVSGSSTVLRDSYSYSLDYINEQEGLVVGDKRFDSFDVVTTSSGDVSEPNLSNIKVTAVQIDGNYGLEFSSGWNAFAGQWVDSNIQFHTAILPSYISAGYAFDGNALALTAYGNKGNVSISENIYTSYPGSSDSIADEAVYYQSSTKKHVSDSVTFAKATDLWVVKDVYVYGATASGFAHLSKFVQTFSQTTPVPEPGTFALAGIGLLTLLGYAWRKQRA